MYAPIEHPRWGAIMGVTATNDINSKDEVLTYYGYPKGNPVPGDFPWYWKMQQGKVNTKSSQMQSKT